MTPLKSSPGKACAAAFPGKLVQVMCHTVPYRNYELPADLGHRPAAFGMPFSISLHRLQVRAVDDALQNFPYGMPFSVSSLHRLQVRAVDNGIQFCPKSEGSVAGSLQQFAQLVV